MEQFPLSKLTQGDKVLPHLCVLVNNYHIEKHRNEITDVMAAPAGKLLGKPPVGFECEADRDEILKIAFGDTSEGRQFRKRFLEIAQTPSGLMKLEEESGGWSSGQAKLC